mgnify:CR=1 FL=1
MSAEDCHWTVDFLLALTKSFKFDMAIMFLEDEENAWVASIVSKIRAVDSAKADQVEKAYTE